CSRVPAFLMSCETETVRLATGERGRLGLLLGQFSQHPVGRTAQRSIIVDSEGGWLVFAGKRDRLAILGIGAVGGERADRHYGVSAGLKFDLDRSAGALIGVARYGFAAACQHKACANGERDKTGASGEQGHRITPRWAPRIVREPSIFRRA